MENYTHACGSDLWANCVCVWFVIDRFSSNRSETKCACGTTSGDRNRTDRSTLALLVPLAFFRLKYPKHSIDRYSFPECFKLLPNSTQPLSTFGVYADPGLNTLTQAEQAGDSIWSERKWTQPPKWKLIFNQCGTPDLPTCSGKGRFSFPTHNRHASWRFEGN